MDRRFHFAQRKSDVEHWISPDQWIVTPLSVLSDLHVPLHVWLLQLQTRNILSTAMTSEQTLWKGNQSSSSDCRGREKSSEKSRLQKQHPCHLFVTNKVTGGCLKGVFFFFFCVQSMSAPSDVSILSLFFLPCKKDVTKTVRNKNNKTKSGGDYFFYFFFRYKWFIASNDLKTSRGQSERKPGTEKIQMLRESFTTGACRIPADSRRCTLNVECCVSSLCKDDSTIRV